MIYGAEDALTLVVDALDYYASNGHPLPEGPLEVRWFVDRHPCDDLPYLLGVEVRASWARPGEAPATL